MSLKSMCQRYLPKNDNKKNMEYFLCLNQAIAKEIKINET